jgi:polar amino acid transport system substrate-binding protein
MSVRTSFAFALAAAVTGALFFANAAQAADEPGCEPAKLATKYPGLVGRTVKLGADPQTPPYVERDGADFNKVHGIAADLAEAVLGCAGVKYEWFLGAWSGLLPAVSSGQIDAMWDDLYYKPDRAQKVDFVMFMGAGTGALVPKGNPAKVMAIDDFCGKTVAYGIGSIEEAATLKQQEACKAGGKTAINTMPFQELSAGLRLLDSGRTDILLWDLGYVGFTAGANPDKYVVAFSMKSGFEIGVGIKKGDKDLVNAIADGLKIMQANGTQKKIFAKYNTAEELQIPVVIKTQ